MFLVERVWQNERCTRMFAARSAVVATLRKLTEPLGRSRKSFDLEGHRQNGYFFSSSGTELARLAAGNIM